MRPYENHPIADCFPMLGESDFQELKEDIRKHGQLARILVFQEMILDGRNRYRACRELGMIPLVAVFPGTYAEAVDMVVSLNLRRRHMDREEIRIAAGKVETLKCGNPVHTVSREIVETCSRKAVAEKFGLSEMEVAKAVTIEKKASPEVKEAYHKREITQGQAFEYAQHAPEKQRELVEQKATIREAKAERKAKSPAMVVLDEVLEKMGVFVDMMKAARGNADDVDGWNKRIDRLIKTLDGLKL